MQSRRKYALAELKRLAEDLKSCKKVLPRRMWEEELDRIGVWANGDGTKSTLPEINKRMGDIKLKVRHWSTLFCLSVPLFQLAGLLFFRNQNLESICWIRFNLSLFKT